MAYENRDVSWLRFNGRILAQAEDENIPLGERLHFLSIYQTNLDEFFMVRMEKWKMELQEQIAIQSWRRDRVYQQLLEQLKSYGIRYLDEKTYHQINEENGGFLHHRFAEKYLPLLTSWTMDLERLSKMDIERPIEKNKGEEIRTDPQQQPHSGLQWEISNIKDPHGEQQPHSGLQCGGTYIAAFLYDRERSQAIGMVSIERARAPEKITLPDGRVWWILPEQWALWELEQVFPQSLIRERTFLRLTSKAETEAVLDSWPVRLEVNRQISLGFTEQLSRMTGLQSGWVCPLDSPMDLDFFSEIKEALVQQGKQRGGDFFYPVRQPKNSKKIKTDGLVLDQVLERDHMFLYPYESMVPFLRLMDEAANDERVCAIAITIYRLAEDSQIVYSLMKAAERGKRVEIIIEPRARFDEKNNREWGKRLEEAGCQVRYGFPALKVHCKLCLITLKTPRGLRYITQIGTGNYNEKTSRLYTDISLVTAEKETGREACMFFQHLREGRLPVAGQRLIPAPVCLEPFLQEKIRKEIEKVKGGASGYIGLKCNHLSHRPLMEQLIRAAHAGVTVQAMVRGICCLPPGEEESGHIQVVRILGRYLEHSRLYIFGQGEDASYYIASADWMKRNMEHRIELAYHVTDPLLCKRLRELFTTLWETGDQEKVRSI